METSVTSSLPSSPCPNYGSYGSITPRSNHLVSMRNGMNKASFLLIMHKIHIPRSGILSRNSLQRPVATLVQAIPLSAYGWTTPATRRIMEDLRFTPGMDAGDPKGAGKSGGLVGAADNGTQGKGKLNRKRLKGGKSKADPSGGDGPGKRIIFFLICNESCRNEHSSTSLSGR